MDHVAGLMVALWLNAHPPLTLFSQRFRHRIKLAQIDIITMSLLIVRLIIIRNH